MKKLRRIVCCLITVLTLMMCFSVGAFAAVDPVDPTPDPAPAATTGKITIKNDKTETNVSIAGKNYSAYKIFDLVQNADHTAYAYTLSEKFEGFFTSTQFKTAFPSADVDESKNSTLYDFVNGLTTAADIEKFANTVYDYITANSATITAEKTVAAAAEMVDGKATKYEYAVFDELPLGYYIIYGEGSPVADATKKVVTACALDTTTWDPTENDYTITIDVKVGVPTIEKKIVLDKGKATESLVDVDTANIGDTVDFRVTSCVPDVTGYTKYAFKMTDTMSKGLTFVQKADDLNGGFTVKIGDDVITNTEDTKLYTVKVNAADGDGNVVIEVEFTDFYKLVIDKAYAAGTAITYDYSGILNKDAVIAPSSNPNTAKITYSNNPHTASIPATDTNTNDTPDDTVEVYTYKLNIFKYTEVGDPKVEKVLADAQFTVKNGKGAEVKFVDLGDGKYRVAEAKDTTTTNTVISAADGYIYISGLKADTYTLHETKAPDGYNLLEEDIVVKIEAQFDPTTNAMSLKAPTTPAGEKPVYTLITDNDGNVDNSGIITKVLNTTGTELPQTGGAGTVAIYIIGGLLIVAAVVSVTVRKLAGRKS